METLILIVTILLILTIFSLFFIIRYYNCKRFVRYVAKKCDLYDYRYMFDDMMNGGDIIMENNEYSMWFLTEEWSSFYYLTKNGPTFAKIFFSFKPLTLENHFDKTFVDKIKNSEVI